MLDTASLIAFLATSRPEDSKKFYRETLGLLFVEDDDNHIVFDSNGTILRIQRVPQVTATGYTALSWEVDNIVSTATGLRAKGVKFERFPGMEQDENDIWMAYDGTMVAWFKDPDGNLLSISEHAERP
jgi:catechol 2,3-dioxygenase-like lactoylglutathione lyase family enzyme